jgi:hypothetical protein
LKNIDALLAATNEINKEPLTKGVEAYLAAFKAQESVLHTMAACAKPADNGKFIHAKIVKPRYDEIRNFGGPKFRKEGVANNLRVVEDAISIFSWY